MATDTVFTRIIRGEIPSYTVYEDAYVIAFLDIAPLSFGHTLLVPKEPAATLDALSSDSAAAMGRVLPALCRAVQRASGAEAYNVLQNNGHQANQAVPHVHVHIIPRPDDQSGLGLAWQPKELSSDAARTLASRMQSAISTDAPTASR